MVAEAQKPMLPSTKKNIDVDDNGMLKIGSYPYHYAATNTGHVEQLHWQQYWRTRTHCMSLGFSGLVTQRTEKPQLEGQDTMTHQGFMEYCVIFSTVLSKFCLLISVFANI